MKRRFIYGDEDLTGIKVFRFEGAVGSENGDLETPDDDEDLIDPDVSPGR